MNRFESNSPQRETAPKEFEWVYEKSGGEWRAVRAPKVVAFSQGGVEEKDRRANNTLKMLRDMEEKWQLNDPAVEHNEGILRDHPFYHDLFIKWAQRYLEMKHFDTSEFSGRLDEGEGNLLLPNGRFSKVWLTNVVANGREWVDEQVANELLISQGFLDITNNHERQEELGIEPENDGWWTQDEV